MHPSRPFRLCFGFALGASLLAAAPARAGSFGDLQIVDRVTGETLQQIRHHGRIYVAGEPGHAYEISFRNRTGERLLAVMSVDGVNVLSGETASAGQSGYVYSPYEQASIKGWRKSLDQIAQFDFTSLSRSYAARTGRPDNVGVIGVALFREALPLPPPSRAAPCCDREDRLGDNDDAYGADEKARQPASAADSASAGIARAAPKPAPAPRLGTGHGPRETSVVGTTQFERASSTPDEVITLYYDSRSNLVAAGILPPELPRLARREPQAFPGGFVPDP